MKNIKACIIATAFVSFFSVSSFGQFTTAFSRDGDASGDSLGRSVSTAGDVNADGFDDIVVGMPNDDNNGTNSGSARVFSGFDGSTLYTFDGDNPFDRFGWSVSDAGDVNADGNADIIVGSPGTNVDTGMIRVFSGLDGSILFTLNGDNMFDQLGSAVSRAGDVNNDGFDDFVAGAPTHLNKGCARVFSGIDGSTLYTFVGDTLSDRFGESVDAASDVNGDGFDDIIVGAPTDASADLPGEAKVFSGIDGSTLFTLTSGASSSDFFAISVAGAGDTNRDGFTDFVCGGGVIGNEAYVFSGFDGTVLHSFVGDGMFDRFGRSVSGAGDINGDGFDDVVVGAAGVDNIGFDSGIARVFSGADGSILGTINGDGMADEFGVSVSCAGDLNGDGFDDIVVGAWRDDNNGTDSGSVGVFLADTRPVLNFSTELEFPHFLDLDWQPDGGDIYSLTGTIICSGATPGSSGRIGVSLAPQDVLAFGFLPVLLNIDSPNLIQLESFGYDGVGDLVVPGVDRQNPALAGTFVYVQCFETAPLILGSNGLRFRLAP